MDLAGLATLTIADDGELDSIMKNKASDTAWALVKRILETVSGTIVLASDSRHQVDHENSGQSYQTASLRSGRLIARRLLEIIVYDRRCRIGGTLTLDELAETSEVGDWKMPDFTMACACAVSQGWLIVEDDALTLTTAGLRTG